MASKRRAHDELAELDERIAKARLAEREAEAHGLAAEASVKIARDAVREAHDLDTNPTDPTARLEQAKKDAEQAALASEG